MKKIIQKGLVLAAGAAIASVLSATSASALLLSVSTDTTSNLGVTANIIDPIPVGFQVMDATVFNTAQQGFNENQNYLLTEDLMVDGGVIEAGTRVASHMIFLNRENELSTNHISHNDVKWTFSHKILGIMTDSPGLAEGLSSSFLGASGVAYPTSVLVDGVAVKVFDNRGLEGGGDAATYDAMIDPYSLMVSMYVTQPGDWIRVVTAVPLPAALPLYGAGVALLGFMGWRRRKIESAA